MPESAQLNILIETGTDFVLPFTVYDNNGNPLDLTGATVESQLREYAEAYDFFEFACMHNGSGGRITVTMPHETTTQIPFTHGVYDVKVTMADGTISHPLSGEAYIKEGVTKSSDGSILFMLGINSFEDLPEVGNVDRLYFVYGDRKIYRWNGSNYIATAVGNGIQSIDFVEHVDAFTDKYRITYDDGTHFDYLVTTRGIDHISLIGSTGTIRTGVVDQYRIYFSDDTTYDYYVTNGRAFDVKTSYDATQAYEYLDMVKVSGATYVAVQDVPANTAITNADYWLKIIAPFTLGTVQSVGYDADPEITITGTPDAPVMNFKVPRGIPGNESIDDTAGEGDTDKVWSADKSYKEIAPIIGLDKFYDGNVEYKGVLARTVILINVNNQGYYRFFPANDFLLPCNQGEKFTVLAKVKSNVSQDYAYMVRFRKYTSSGQTGVYFNTDEFTESIISEVTVTSSDVTQVGVSIHRKYTGDSTDNFNETFDVEYFIVIRGTIDLNNAVKIKTQNITDQAITNNGIANDTISPTKLTPLTDKYGMLLRYGVKPPNYDTTTQQLTIYKGTVIVNLKTNVELIRTTENIILDSNSASQVNYLVFDTTTNTFTLRTQGRLYDTEIYLGAISLLTGAGQIKCTHTIDGYPVGSDLLLSEIAEKLPDNWKSKIEDINTAKGTKFTFAVQTDTHYYIGYGDTSAYNLNLLTNYVGFDFVTNLGDVIRGYADETIDSNDNMRKAMTDIMHRYVTNISCPLMIAMGNHDTNRMWAEAFSDTPFTFDEVWGRLFRPSFNTNVIAETQTGLMYYYTDFDDVRVIILNTQDGANGAFGIRADQLAWFTNIALNTDKWVLVMSHVPLVNGWSVGSNYDPSYANIVTALQNFKMNNGKVIGCMSGHTHTQENKTVDGILYVTFRNGADLAEVVMIDLDAKTVNTIPVGFTGAGNRSFSFE